MASSRDGADKENSQTGGGRTRGTANSKIPVHYTYSPVVSNSPLSDDADNALARQQKAAAGAGQKKKKKKKHSGALLSELFNEADTLAKGSKAKVTKEVAKALRDSKQAK